MWAVRRKNLTMARYLLKNHSRVNFKDEMGRTALNFAVVDGDVKMIQSLLCFKADPTSENNQGTMVKDLYQQGEPEVEVALELVEKYL